jgi:hypothetical protein
MTLSSGVTPSGAEMTEVILYTCPTGGWILGNRFLMEHSIKKSIPNAHVTHKVAAPFTAVAAINGKKGRRQVG